MKKSMPRIIGLLGVVIFASVATSSFTVYAFVGKTPKVGVPWTFSPGEMIESEKVNQNFSTLATAITNNEFAINHMEPYLTSTVRGENSTSLASGNATEFVSGNCNSDEEVVACRCWHNGEETALTEHYPDIGNNRCVCGFYNNDGSTVTIHSGAVCAKVVY